MGRVRVWNKCRVRIFMSQFIIYRPKIYTNAIYFSMTFDCVTWFYFYMYVTDSHDNGIVKDKKLSCSIFFLSFPSDFTSTICEIIKSTNLNSIPTAKRCLPSPSSAITQHQHVKHVALCHECGFKET